MEPEFKQCDLWTVQEPPYTIEYHLLYSQNTCFDEYELWEYGIGCKLYDQHMNMISETTVDNISKDFQYVSDLVSLLMKHRVFPAHLYDVVSDQLVVGLDYSY